VDFNTWRSTPRLAPRCMYVYRRLDLLQSGKRLADEVHGRCTDAVALVGERRTLGSCSPPIARSDAFAARSAASSPGVRVSGIGETSLRRAGGEIVSSRAQSARASRAFATPSSLRTTSSCRSAARASARCAMRHLFPVGRGQRVELGPMASEDLLMRSLVVPPARTGLVDRRLRKTDRSRGDGRKHRANAPDRRPRVPR
jgi:hypothetical protein